MMPNLLAAVLAADRTHLWHPYTPMDEWRARHNPLVVDRAEGSFLILHDGQRLFDGNGSWWVSSLGHQHPRLVRALVKQAEKMCHVSLAGITHESAALLAQEMAAIAPGGRDGPSPLDQVFFSDDGSTAIEAAVKMAIQYHRQISPTSGKKKTKFLALDQGFHGEAVGGTSLGGVEVFRRPFADVVFETLHVPSPAGESRDCAPHWGEAYDSLAQVIEQSADSIAAMVLEPIVQGAAGMKTYPAAYLRAARDLCTKHNILLIADEVFVGYGRLGRMWACELADVCPDLLCTAKGFTAGMLPMAATLATSAVLDAFSGGRARAFLHGHSYCGNPLGAAVAREVLAIYREERIVEGVAAREQLLRESFERMAADPISSRLVQSVRILGAMAAADLRSFRGAGKSSVTSTTVPTVETDSDLGPSGGYTAGVGWQVYDEARKRGAYLRPLGDVVYVTPALNMPLDELSALLAIVEDSVRTVASLA